MPIKGFAENTRMKPIVTVQVGANVPVGCKCHTIYAESPETGKCVNELDGECPYFRTEKASFGYQKPETFCPAAGLNEAQLGKKGLKTRPTQLGFFMIPQTFRVPMGLPDRPTEIPNIVLASHKLEVVTDPNTGRVISAYEPVEAIEEYPILEYNLMWWSKTELVCRGDGEVANMYPASPGHPNHMKARKCEYRDCPDFIAKGQCKENGEIFFRVKNSPGFPALWKFGTRSRKAIEYLLNELRDIHSVLGHVSLIPLKLTLEKEKAHPMMDRKDRQTGEITKQKVETEVYRVHIRTEFTMNGAISAKREALAFLTAGSGELKQLREATPSIAPDPEPPVEMGATAESADYQDEEILDGSANTAPPSAKKAPAPDPAAPPPAAKKAPAPAPAKKAPAPAAPKPQPSKQADNSDAKLNLTPEQRKVEYMKLQEVMGHELNDAKSVDQLRAVVAKYNPMFEKIGRMPHPDDPETYVVKMFRDHINHFKKKVTGNYAPAASAPVAPKTPAPTISDPSVPLPAPVKRLKEELSKRDRVEIIRREQPGVVTDDVLTLVGKESFVECDDSDYAEIFDMLNEALPEGSI